MSDIDVVINKVDPETQGVLETTTYTIAEGPNARGLDHAAVVAQGGTPEIEMAVIDGEPEPTLDETPAAAPLDEAPAANADGPTPTEEG